MPKWITDLFSYLPEDAKHLLAYLAGMAVAMYLIRKILGHLQSQEVKTALRAVKKAGASFGEALAKQAKPPKPYPCAEFVLEVIFVANNYLMALVFFSLFVLVAVLTANAHSQPLLNILGGMVFAMVCFYLTMFMYAEAERGRLAIPTLWEKCRGGTRS